MIDGLLPGDFLPGIGDPLADHRLGDAVLVGGITKGKTALNAGVTVVGMAILVRHHAHDLGPLHLGLERAADSAVGTGGNDAVLGLPLLNDGLLHKGCCGTCLDAGPAGDALRIHEILILTRRDLGIESAAIDGQRESALHFLAGPDTAGADNAL